MQCPRCTAESSSAARFCAICGANLSADVPEPGLRAQPNMMAQSCHRCGQTLPPSAYFSRGVNIAKLVALLPINFVLPVIFFFLRKDRVICAHCRKLLPEAAPPALLPAMGAAPGGALIPALAPGGLMTTAPEARQLETASQRARHRGVWLGLFAMPLSLPLFAMLSSAGLSELAIVGLPGGLLALGSVNAFRRAGRLLREARAAEAKNQRRQVLSLARQHGGRLSVSEVAAALGLDLKDAEAVLDTLVDGRHVDVEVTHEGRLVYVFPDLAP